MTAGFPLQNLRPVLRLIAGRTFTNYLEYLSFCHSGLKLRKPLVHLAADTHQKRDNYQECSIHDADFTNGGHVLQPYSNSVRTAVFGKSISPCPEGTPLANRLGTMRRRPQASSPVEFGTLDIDEEVAPLKGPDRGVLLLEDRDDFRQVLHDHLVFRSYEVTSVRSGVEGLREIMKGAFDLIICDMMMPQVGGEMFYWAVTRARPATARRFIFFYRPQEQSGDGVFLPASERDGAHQALQAGGARLGDPRCPSQTALMWIPWGLASADGVSRTEAPKNHNQTEPTAGDFI